MCKVKTGEAIQTVSDLQNLVTSVILRQSEPFTVESIENQVAEQLVGSPFLDDAKVSAICARTMSYMAMSRGICSMGTYDSRYRLTLPFPSYNPAMMNVG